MKKTRICDLPDLFGAPHPRPVMYCRQCGHKESANRDNWAHVNRPDYVITCCNVPMALVTEQVIYNEVS